MVVGLMIQWMTREASRGLMGGDWEDKKNRKAGMEVEGSRETKWRVQGGISEGRRRFNSTSCTDKSTIHSGRRKSASRSPKEMREGHEKLGLEATYYRFIKEWPILHQR